MATGRLGTADVGATTNTTIYTVPTGNYTVGSISIANRNATTVKFRLALATSGSPGNADWIEYDTSIVGNGVFERTGLVMQAGLLVVVFSDTANLSVSVYGIETSTV
jgi:hypothetical protein